MSDSHLTDPTPAAAPRPRPSTSGRVANRLAAVQAGFDRRVRGFLWRPEPRFPGSAARGRQFMAGNYRLGGALIEAHGQSPWDITAPNDSFEEGLHGFDWLDDLAAIDDGEGRKTAQAWLSGWVRRYGRGAGLGWTPDLTGRRQIRWISHALFLLNGMESAESRRFMASLGRQAGFLSRRWRRASPGLPRFEALTGLIYSACTLMGMESDLDPALKALAQECAQEIDASGGIVTRNPEELLEVFVLLTWVMQILSDTGKEPDPAVNTAIARIAPTLRSLRHVDGGLVRAHGGGRGAPGRLVSALVQSRVRPAQVKGLAMGFARLATDNVSIIVDAALPMQGLRSANAHASTLAMELTSGSEPLIVSCGSGARLGPEWRRAGRATLSHSTLCLEGYSSSRLAPKASRNAPEKQPFADGPSDVAVQESDMKSAQGVAMSHDGWRKSHGLIHLRSLTLEDNGSLLRGEDALAAMTSADRQRLDRVYARLPHGLGVKYTVRFHLHPDVDAKVDMGGAAVSLTLASGETWVFRHTGSAELGLQPSVYLDSGRLRPRATKQIVLTARMKGYGNVIGWSLARPTAFLPAPVGFARATPD
ncbi:Heparinase II/III-like protein [Roseibacterium elongatum DSM 19469]|uniref:Heparinase II/III-like protein n=1 Tax=Roseicyclus elongatus DSM 19469 TaxID=1294273 RepID=W8RZC6_9RHOB|nr:heparinase II/III family protein [Roseibacterium elongatum]AHM03232.1 Heparinase II/III-like protein [Roseibacterium elongatum DSM 19469]